MPETDRLVIRPGRVALWLSLMATALSGAHLVMVYLRRAHDMDVVMGLAQLFDFFHEGNFPSYFSALLLLGAAGLLALLGCSTAEEFRRHRFHWLLLALVFTFLSCDELLALHERLMLPTRQSLNTTGLLYAAWIIPYGAALLALAVFFWRWFVALPVATRWRFLTAAGLFLMGAIVLEALSGAEWEAHKTRTLLLDACIFFEDVFEMAGAIVFIWALLLELARARIAITFGGPPGPT
ncbi:MAG: hypothetical protein J0M20_13510 [Burkholderiales bacterium]|nr:hypothetical protein [Burkholderiales bacterium]